MYIYTHIFMCVYIYIYLFIYVGPNVLGARRVPGVNLLFRCVSRIARLQGRGGWRGGGAVTTFYDRTHM